MNKGMLLKLVAMGLLAVLLIVILVLIGGTIGERANLRNVAVADIARSSSGEQTLLGPVLVVPYRRTATEWQMNDDGSNRRAVTRQVEGRLVFAPEQFNLDGQISTEQRARGIYSTRLFHSVQKINGGFEVPVRYGIDTDYESYTFQAPILSVGLSDIRGIETGLALKLDGVEAKLVPGSSVHELGNGVHAELAAWDASQPKRLAFALDLRLQGTGQLQVTPIGRNSSIVLRSDWPHPGFIGQMLPVRRTIGASGFSAEWQATFFATNIDEALKDCLAGRDCVGLKTMHFGVDFVDPVDQYLKTERAIKYALLFIGLTFAGFFLFEVLRQLAVHPMQYGLVGVALALFYLLLLALSEHIGFPAAYLISATACVALIGYYVGHILHSAWRGLGFSAALAALYAVLYGLLSSEDYALLMGSVLVFLLLGAVMVLTRRVDWFAVTGRRAAN